MNMYILAALITVFSFQLNAPEIAVTKAHSAPPFLNITGTVPFVNSQIKWTWQLPRSVRSAFNKSNHADWYIEKMIQYNSGNKTVYRFYLNNGNLLDGDHKDCFFKSASLDITDNGMVLGH